ncbi:glutathione S-transferase family protein [Sphingomonas sp.]|uniref:glutathione S-transferase family protein n=1 Tax=Sphingomonas sp. TaxID=28214 RepID=UPI0035BBAB27
MIVYGSSLSPFVRKVLAFAAEKGVAVEVVRAGMGQGGPDFAEASPFAKMPALRDPGADGGRDFVISDSTAICHYIEAKYPEHPLIPAGPVARARVVWFDEFADTMLAAVGGKMFFNRFVAPMVLKRPGDLGIASRAEAEELRPLLDYLERVVPDEGFLVGDALTLADIAVASPFVNLHHIGWMHDTAYWPRLAGYATGILARPSFAPMIASEQRMIAAMSAAGGLTGNAAGNGTDGMAAG